MVVCNEWTKMDEVVLVQGDLVELGDACDIYECADVFADAAFEFEDEVGAARDNAGMSPLFGHYFERFFNGGCVDIVVPHDEFMSLRERQPGAISYTLMGIVLSLSLLAMTEKFISIL